jgi:hypothetical protein
LNGEIARIAEPGGHARRFRQGQDDDWQEDERNEASRFEQSMAVREHAFDDGHECV